MGSQPDTAPRLGASDDRPAVTLKGRTWSYAELAALVDRFAMSANGTRPSTVAVSGQDPLVATGPVVDTLVVDTLVTVFAAAALGRPVLVSDPATPVPKINRLPAGTFLIVVTSGTSGRPKPVLRSAASWVSSFAPLAQLTGIGGRDRVLLTGPLHATLHLFAAVHTLALGAELTDRAELATAVHAVPAALAVLLDELPTGTPLRTAVVAGSALPDGLADRAVARGISVVEYYGAAELSFVAARRHPEPLRPFPGAEINLRDDVLWVRSPYLSLGYPGGVTGPFRRDDHGFGTVGDLAEQLPDGGLLIRGRGDAAITTGGATVIAEDVEAALAALPGVAAVAVVGVPHARLGQLVTAVIEPVPGADLGGLRAAARVLLRDQFLPRRWLLTDRLPVTPSGKVNRYAAARAAGRFVDQDPAHRRAPDPALPELPALRPLP